MSIFRFFNNFKTCVMKLYLRISICLISLFLFVGVLPAQNNWELKKDEDGIKIYTSNQKESVYKKFKAIAVFTCKPIDMVEILKDANNYNNWVADCENVKLLTQDSIIQYHYIEISLPWPFDNRDMIYKFEYNILNSSKIKVSINGVPDYINKKKGVVRMDKVSGEWLFELIGDNKTKVTYMLHSEPGGEIPGWLANTTVVDMPYNTIIALQKIVGTISLK